jgi:hypothetical protein
MQMEVALPQEWAVPVSNAEYAGDDIAGGA